MIRRISRREALQELSALFAIPLLRWPDRVADPLAGTIVEYQRTTLGYGNWLGLPEVSVPAGLGADGMPAGNISFVGLPGSDARILELAHSYERQSKRFMAPPRDSR